QALRDLRHLARDLGVVVQRRLLRQDLLERLQPERLLVLRSDALVDQHGLAGVRIGAAVGEPVPGGVAGEQDQHPPAQPAAAPAPGALLSVAEGILSHAPLLVRSRARGRAPPGSRAVRWWCRRRPARATPSASAPVRWPRRRRASPACGTPG